jgi:hypothetical protein
MPETVRRPLALVAAGLAATGGILASPLRAQVHRRTAVLSGCSPSMQGTGACIGFSATGGEDPYLAAVASQLRGGHVAVAHRFVALVKPKLSATTAQALSAALDGARTSPATAAEQLDATNSAAAVNAPLSALPHGAPAVGSAAAATRMPTLASHLAPEATASTPREARNGEPKAMSSYNWLLHGSDRTPLYYGYCNPNECRTLGSEEADLRADTYFPQDGAHWNHHIVHRSGAQVHFSGVKVRLMRDISGSPDTTKATLPCASAGPSLGCDGYTRSGTQVGHWYYFRLDLTNSPVGGPSSTYQGQTRRYNVTTPKLWVFRAFDSGG